MTIGTGAVSGWFPTKTSPKWNMFGRSLSGTPKRFGSEMFRVRIGGGRESDVIVGPDADDRRRVGDGDDVAGVRRSLDNDDDDVDGLEATSISTFTMELRSCGGSSSSSSEWREKDLHIEKIYR